MNQGGLEQLAAKDRSGRIPLHLAAAVRTPPALLVSLRPVDAATSRLGVDIDAADRQGNPNPEVLSYLLLCRPEGEPLDPHAAMDEEQRVEALAARSRRCMGCCAARPSNS